MSLNDTTLALNTFITCTVLANCKLCYDPGTQIDLFQGLILGLFMTTGANINIALLKKILMLIHGLALRLITIKVSVFLAHAVIFKMKGSNQWLLALRLSQSRFYYLWPSQYF